MWRQDHRERERERERERDNIVKEKKKTQRLVALCLSLHASFPYVLFLWRLKWEKMENGIWGFGEGMNENHIKGVIELVGGWYNMLQLEWMSDYDVWNLPSWTEIEWPCTPIQAIHIV